MKTITIASEKGGVGRTTTAVNLAHGLTRREKAVLLVDLDPQGQIAISLGLQPESGVFNALYTAQEPEQLVRNTGRKNLWLIPGDKRTATLQIILQAEQANTPDMVYRAFVKPWKQRLDFVIFDTASRKGCLQEAALALADLSSFQRFQIIWPCLASAAPLKL